MKHTLKTKLKIAGAFLFVLAFGHMMAGCTRQADSQTLVKVTEAATQCAAAAINAFTRQVEISEEREVRRAARELAVEAKP